MKALQFPLNVKVTSNHAGYTTQTVGSHRGSSTSSAETAMGRLVDRLTTAQELPIGTLRAVQLPADAGWSHCVTVWRIERAA